MKYPVSTIREGVVDLAFCKLDNPLAPLTNIEWVRITTPLFFEHLILKSDWESYQAFLKKEQNATIG